MNTNIVGLIGEIQTCNALDDKHIDMPINYIANFPIRDKKDKYFQVDTLVVCRKGIFCIEVKNWNAEVYCGTDGYWSAVYPSGEQIVKSPVAQNIRHCNKVQAICGTPVQSAVLFTDSGVLHNQPAAVMYVSEFIPYISKLPDIYTDDFVKQAYEGLQKYKKKIEVDLLVNFIFKSV